MKKSEQYFKNELELINNNILREKTIFFLDEVVPDYFWEVPASSSGKYHPLFAICKNGLVKHTKMCVRIAIDMFDIEPNRFSNLQKDKIVVSLLCHDSFKYGIVYDVEKFSGHDFVAGLYVEFLIDHDCGEYVRCHMGRWGMHRPSGRIEEVIHICDYIASRKYLIYDPIV